MKQIDGFELLRELGRGGMGVVYEARHPQLDRTVALKVFDLGAATHEDQLRFEREAQLLARVRHPNVVAIHSFGRCTQGPYLVTERVAGDELGALLRMGPLDPARAVHLVAQVAAGVSALHAEGVVHRDLKPANVIVTPDGSAKLLDFGVARDVSAERLTQTGTIVGTPAFMAPEQAEAEGSREPDPRTDVYGLGAILFTLLAGRPPFAAPSLLKLLALVVNEPPRWPDEALADVPSALRAICEQALAKAPEDRHPSADALREDLLLFLAGGAPGRSASAWAVAAGALGVTLAMGLAALTVPRGEPARAPSPPEPPAQAALSPAEIVNANRELTAALVRPPSERLPVLVEWLGRYSGHPRRAEAERARRRTRLEVPLATIQHYRPLDDGDDHRVRVHLLDATRLLTWGRDSNLRLWDLNAPQQPTWTAPGVAQGKGWVVRIPGTDSVLSGSSYALTRVHLPSGRQSPLPLPRADTRSLAFGLRGTRLIASRSLKEGVTLYAWPSLEVLAVFDVEPLRLFALDPSGRYAAGPPNQSNAVKARNEPLKLHVFDLERAQIRCTFELTAPTTAVAFPDSAHVIAGNGAGEILVFDCSAPEAPGRPLKARTGLPPGGTPTGPVAVFAPKVAAHASAIAGLALSPDSRTLYSAADARGLVLRYAKRDAARRSKHKVWSYPEGEELISIEGGPSDACSLHAHAGRLAVGHSDGIVQVFVAGRP